MPSSSAPAPRRPAPPAALALVLALMLPLGLAGCAGESRTVVAGRGEGALLSVKAGQVLEVALDSNPTTGYSWSLTRPPDPELLEFISQHYLANSAVAGRVGAGGREVFSFRGLKPGVTTMELTYARPWEKGDPKAEARRRQVSVAVR